MLTRIGARENLQHVIRQQCEGNVYVGSHFYFDACLCIFDRSASRYLLLDSTLLSPDFERT